MNKLLKWLGITDGDWKNEIDFVSGNDVYFKSIGPLEPTCHDTIVCGIDDANMIKASPDMLIALVEMKKQFGYINCIADQLYVDRPEHAEYLVTHAIEKATGKTWDEILTFIMQQIT